MGYDPITVGAMANDRTGDANRTAWIKANSMLNELYTNLALCALDSNLTAETSARAAADATHTADIAARALLADVLYKANLTQVVRTDDAVGLTSDRRLLTADNSGLQVTIPFELYSSGETPVPTSFVLPPLLGDFVIHSVYFAMYAAGGSRVTAELRADDDEELIARAESVETAENGPGVVRLTSFATTLFKSRLYRFDLLNIENLSEYEPHLGGVIWIRGAWARSLFSAAAGDEGEEFTSYMDDFLTIAASKADLEDGTVPLDQLPVDLVGKLRQFVAVTPKTDTATGSNNAPTWASAYSGSITLSKPDSKVLVLATGQFGGSNAYSIFARLQRAGSPLLEGDAAGARIRSQHFMFCDHGRRVFNPLFMGMDTPGAGTHTYSIAVASESGGSWFFNRSSDDTNNDWIGRTGANMFIFELAP